MDAYLPVLSITLEHDRVLRLRDLVILLLLDLLHLFLRRESVVLGERAVVALLQRS